MIAVNKYEQRAREVHSLLCVGLDSDYERLPEQFKQEDAPQFAFNRRIIEQTHPYASAYKINTAFYEARGEQGWRELKQTMDYLDAEHPEILTICDAKRGDIGSSSAAYADAIFDHLDFDAVTLNPYLGMDSLQPFLDRKDKGCIILCRTSNPGSSEFQSLELRGRPLWQIIAERVRDDWNSNYNCMLVVGATYPEDLKQVRDIVGEMTLLVPGVGVQGGSVEAIVRAGLNNDGLGLIIHAARSVIFSDNPSYAAQALRDQINQYY
jgi:orotidine-5'-phosphate decarboxylase